MATQFFALPRELRDLIYSSLITSTLLVPAPESTHDRHVWQLHNGAYFSRAPPPRISCAAMLATNRQVHSELSQAFDRARRAGVLAAKLDCIVKEAYAGGPWFTWLSIPLVNRKVENVGLTSKKSSVVNVKSWGSTVPVVGRLLQSLALRTAREEIVDQEPCVSMEKLRIDIRLFDTVAQRKEDVSWAICSALRRICQHGKEVGGNEGWPESLTIDTLVLNVISLPMQKESANKVEPERDIARLLAHDLINMWNTLWSRSHAQSRHYTILLERIKRVKFCVEGVLIRERELRLELERGRAERGRIAMRIG